MNTARPNFIVSLVLLFLDHDNLCSKEYRQETLCNYEEIQHPHIGIWVKYVVRRCRRCVVIVGVPDRKVGHPELHQIAPGDGTL